MGRSKYSLGLSIGVFMAVLLGSAILGAIIPLYSGEICSWGNGTSLSSTSTNPSSPTYLYDESAQYVYYSSSYYYYYYRTSSSAGSYYYHVVWLAATDSGDNFNLYLYSDSVYSNLKASSTLSSGVVDWVVFRPSSSQYYYPKVYRYSGYGYAYIEWEGSSSYLSLGSDMTGSLSTSEHVEIFRVSLSTQKQYKISLDVPSGGDFNLYLYYLTPGSATNSYGYIQSSSNYGYDIDETISSIKPDYEGEYAIVVVRYSGSGTFVLELEEEVFFSTTAVVIAVFGIMAAVGVGLGVYYKYRSPQAQNPTGQAQRLPSGGGELTLSESLLSKKASHAIKTPQGKVPFFKNCPYCNSRNDFEEFFCKSCGTEL